jgi:hypothetical protein
LSTGGEWFGVSDVTDLEAAIELTEEYAATACLGKPGEVLDVRQEGRVWVVEIETHTFSETDTHQLRITEAVGKAVAHDRERRRQLVERFDRARQQVGDATVVGRAPKRPRRNGFHATDHTVGHNTTRTAGGAVRDTSRTRVSPR